MAVPFLRWAGSKRALAPTIAQHLPPWFAGYHEPFLGGGALFFYLHEKGRLPRRVHLSDFNGDLIEAYQEVRSDALAVHAALPPVSSRAEYLALRASVPGEALARAGRFLTLNASCFNGLHRLNADGRFNVPWGNRVASVDERNLVLAGRALQCATLQHQRYDEALARVRPGELVYLDPPYDGMFSGYVSESWGEVQHRKMADAATRCVERGVWVVISQANTPLIRGLYQGWRTIAIAARHAIGVGTGADSSVRELLLIGGPVL